MSDFSDFQARPCPAWFATPQLGIFIHWGIYAVPAFAPRGRPIHDLMRADYDHATVLAPYAEWYANALRVDASPTRQHHLAHYGDAPYEDFRATFDARSDAFDAAVWVDTFVAAGAGYIVLVAKHHDGYCLWPTEVSHPHRPGWHTQRDFVGELADAARAAGLRFGIYYSGGLDWSFYHTPISNMGDMLACVPPGDAYRNYAHAQLRELINRYRPSVLWNDIAWPDKADVPDLFAHYYAVVPDGVVNDRWLGETGLFDTLRTADGLAAFNRRMKTAIAAADGALPMSPPPHCDFRTVEYGLGTAPLGKKWEACRGVGLSFGYCAHEDADDYLSHSAFAATLADVKARGGNLLINVGPMPDGTLPDLQRAALLGG
jgi:alpha-L-fucosidase